LFAHYLFCLFASQLICDGSAPRSHLWPLFWGRKRCRRRWKALCKRAILCCFVFHGQSLSFWLPARRMCCGAPTAFSRTVTHAWTTLWIGFASTNCRRLVCCGMLTLRNCFRCAGWLTNWLPPRLHCILCPQWPPRCKHLNCTSRMPFLMATLWSWAGLMLRSTSPLGAVCVSQLPLTAQLRAKCDCSSRSWLMNLIQIRCSKRLGSCLVCAVFSHLFAAVSLPSLHCGFCAAGWQCGPFSGCHCADHVWGPHVAHTHRPHCNNCPGCCE